MKYGKVMEPEPIPTTPLEVFGADLRKKRKFWHMSQRRMAELAGTTQANIASIEAGKGNHTMDLLSRVAGVIRFDVKITLARRPNKPVPR